MFMWSADIPQTAINRRLAIQLFGNKGSINPVWTPNDTAEEWLLAKMFFNNSNGQVSSWSN